nr:basic proline-rich protein-like [Anolis sagrei ordinatus]
MPGWPGACPRPSSSLRLPAQARPGLRLRAAPPAASGACPPPGEGPPRGGSPPLRPAGSPPGGSGGRAPAPEVPPAYFRRRPGRASGSGQRPLPSFGACPPPRGAPPCVCSPLRPAGSPPGGSGGHAPAPEVPPAYFRRRPGRASGFGQRPLPPLGACPPPGEGPPGGQLFPAARRQPSGGSGGPRAGAGSASGLLPAQHVPAPPPR